MSREFFNEIDGGSRSRARSSLPPLRRSRRRPDEVRRVHAVFSLIGLVAAIGGVIWAYAASSSIALAIFVFLMTSSYIGRGLGDVATDPQKGRRFVYFTLQPVLAVGVLVLAYLLWGIMWLAVLLGFVLGLTLWQLVVIIFFPGIHGPELLDSQERLRTGGL